MQQRQDARRVRFPASLTVFWCYGSNSRRTCSRGWKKSLRRKIKNAVILSGAGGVRGYHVHQISNRDFPSKNMFEKNPNAPADLISMNGYIIDGRIHAHMTLATPDKAFGGHLEPGTEVFTFGIVTLGVMKEGADFSHLDDKAYR
ncbi:MAG: PPC domain-containing DNA-binding protein [Bryobacteraceae bacterium]